MSERTPLDPHEYEPRWRDRWRGDGIFEVELDRSDDSKFYNLVEFPYPSAEGLHVGHVYTYCGADTYGRYQRMRGRRVFQPIGFDSFGIHTENFALKVGENPRPLTDRTIANYRRQLGRVGAAWAWGSEVVTSEPDYYRWTQWIFVQLFKAGLAERRSAPVTWCPSCLTVLANEQLEGDRCERCGTEVTEKVMQQWFLKMTRYADQLVDGLDDLDWSEQAKKLQRDWIGRSRGAEIDFRVAGTDHVLSAFTTRPDTVFGVTFVAVAPDHPLAAHVVGRVAVNPANGAQVPVLAGEHVVTAYGTGVVMGVPAHDQRDLDFARERGLPVATVVEPPGPITDRAWTGEGTLIDSGPFTGMPSRLARSAIVEWLTRRGAGRATTRYRLRDWLISRQRYWGPPIPIIHCEDCGPVPVPEEELPVLLPDVVDFRPTGTGLSPLASVPDFVATVCPGCGRSARRETDVSDTFLDSAWYFLRYVSPKDQGRPWDPQRIRAWLPVDLYAGGQEHLRRHHLYARFLTRALHDLGWVPFAEPFPRLRVHGLLIQAGAKMSKSRGNVVDPDAYIDRIGADNLRMYLLFCGPWEQGGEFNDQSLSGIVRFTRRLGGLLHEDIAPGRGLEDVSQLDRAVARIEDEIERFKFNTAIAALMELTNWAVEVWPEMSAPQRERATKILILLLAPLAPHLAEELWARLGQPYSVHQQRWPAYDPAALVKAEVTLIVQVDGRLRAKLSTPAGLTQPEALALALTHPSVVRQLDGRTPEQVIHVSDRLINLVTKAGSERRG